MLKYLFNKANKAYKMKKLTMGLTNNIPPRNSIPCRFDGIVSYNDFLEMVDLSAKKIKNRGLQTRVCNSIIYCKVESVTGLSSWSFKVDFNDYGNLTGEYWINSENDDSKLPEIFAEDIKEMIKSPQYFQSLKSKQYEADNPNYIFDCPCCKSKKTLIKNMNNGDWKCWRCDFSISDYMLKNEKLWFCGRCGDCLNIQPGFKPTMLWRCTICGTNNTFNMNN